MIVTAWQPPVVHLIDLSHNRTLCGIALGREMETGDEADPYDVETNVACGCLRCARAAKRRMGVDRG